MGKLNIILPDFIIIGANKAGTTSVANYLNSHPSIKISDVKEPMFFSSNPLQKSADKKNSNLKQPFFITTLDSYSGLFEKHKPTAEIFGEASTSYLAIPRKSAFLMKKIVPEVKIIVILREPVDRAISAYKMCYGNGIEKRSFSEVVRDSRNHTKVLNGHGVKEYVRNGLYYQLLREYFKCFDRSQLLILNYDELILDAHRFMSKIMKFLRIEEFRFDMGRRYNTERDNLKGSVPIESEDINQLKRMYIKEIEELNANVNLSLDRWLAFLNS